MGSANIFQKVALPPAIKQDRDGYTPLHTAAANPDCYDKLVAIAEPLNKTQIDTPNRQGDTALHVAIKESNKKAAAFLIKNGADLTRPSIGGLNATQLIKHYFSKKEQMDLLPFGDENEELETTWLNPLSLTPAFKDPLRSLFTTAAVFLMIQTQTPSVKIKRSNPYAVTAPNDVPKNAL